MKKYKYEMPAIRGIEGDYHILLEDYHIEGILPDGRVFEFTIKAGFVFDGASIPRALWWLCKHPLSVPRIVAALIHDWLYSAHVCDRGLADLIYRVLCIDLEIFAADAWVQYSTLRCWGWMAWNGHDESDEASARELGVFMLEGEEMKAIEAFRQGWESLSHSTQKQKE